MNVSIWSWGDRARGAACNDMTSGDTGAWSEDRRLLPGEIREPYTVITSEAGWQLF